MWPWSEIELLKSSLRLFAGEHVLSKVMKERENALKLGGEKREVTLMFLDIAGITAVGDGLDPGQLGTFIGKYLEIVTESVFAHGGTIDSYTGDAVFAWWGNEDKRMNAKNACDCANAITSRIESQNEAWSLKNLPNIQVKIGMDSGPVMLGNYGTSRRMKYTVLGDHVNLASRLCNLANGHYGARILLSEFTREELDASLVVRPIDVVMVKGKERPVTLFELVGHGSEIAAEQAKFLETFGAAFASYLKGDFSDAIATFEAAQQIRPGDRPTEILISRCREYQSDPPKQPWDGVFTFRISYGTQVNG